MKPYVAKVTFDVSFHSNSDDPLADFMEHNSELAEMVYEHFGNIEIQEDDMEVDECTHK